MSTMDDRTSDPQPVSGVFRQFCIPCAVVVEKGQVVRLDLTNDIPCDCASRRRTARSAW